ncbi:MAG: hypothetical protein IJS60_03540 [Abditibacteriota bacterium]|nr:hypothetical protein [Abditibacteriota bacterium]
MKSIEELLKTSLQKTKATKQVYEADIETFKYFDEYSNKKKFEDWTYEDLVDYKSNLAYKRLNVITIETPGDSPFVGAPVYCNKDYEELLKSYQTDDTKKNFIDAFIGDDACHYAPDWEKLVNKGFVGVLNEINEYDKNAPKDKKPFYKACRREIEAILNYIERVEKLCIESNLPKQAECCRNLRTKAPQTFYEALQAILFLHYTLFWGEWTTVLFMGHFDYILYPFYKRDIETGILTRGKAVEFLCYFFIEHATCQNPNNAEPIIIGGLDPDGNEVVNDLTFDILKAKRQCPIENPGVALAYFKGMNEELLKECFDTIWTGNPALFNNDLIVKALVEQGVEERDARLWSIQTCAEIGVAGKGNIWGLSPLYNTAEILNDTIKHNLSCETFDSFKEAFKDNIKKKIDIEFKVVEKNMAESLQKCARPMLSCFVDDCLEKGLDYSRGGIKYKWVQNNFIGVTTVVDSLISIREIVFNKKICSLEELYQALKNDFENQILLKEIQKLEFFGNDNPENNLLAREIYDCITKESMAHEICGHPYMPGAFGYLFHTWMGREFMATSDGRKANTSLSDGMGATRGRDKNGPTSLINSALSIDQSKMLGGNVLNLKFDKSFYNNKKNREAIKNLAKTYMDRGGFEIQFTVTDTQELIDAKAHPEEHGNLIVRVAGYSDYFVLLDPKTQDEIIDRSMIDRI